MEVSNGTQLDKARLDLLHAFCRLQLPTVILSRAQCESHLERTHALFQSKTRGEVTWDSYLDNLYPLDWFVASACLEALEPAWEYLFASRAGRSDTLLLDALRARAARLYPGNEERQESAVLEFWTDLYVPPDRPGSLPVLARYDGVRPLVPWLIRVFQNWHISELRKENGTQHLPEDDMMVHPAGNSLDRWHDVFCAAAQDWLELLGDKELILLGLRLRYQLSQREVAGILDMHEGTISRRTDALSEQWKDRITQHMLEAGWTGDDLSDYIRTEMRNLLLDDPRLSVDSLASLLNGQGKSLPDAVPVR